MSFLTNLKRTLIFALVLSLFHYYFSQERYYSLIDIRRQYTFESLNVPDVHVGIRILNCLCYIALITVDFLTKKSSIPPVEPQMVDGALKELVNKRLDLNGVHSRKNSGSAKGSKQNSRKNSNTPAKEPELDLNNKLDRNCSVNQAEKERMQLPESANQIGNN